MVANLVFLSLERIFVRLHLVVVHKWVGNQSSSRTHKLMTLTDARTVEWDE